jgi:putative hydrolase of the HAD superfamily
MKLKALIFDVDGTIANTEREGHLPACNDAFAELGYPIRWDWETYRDRFIPLAGTPVRVRRALQEHAPEMDDAALDAAAQQIAVRKREIYLEKYVTAATLRRGVRELVAAAAAQGIRLAIVTLSAEEQVRAMLQYRLPEYADLFEPLLGKHAGPKHAFGSPLYSRARAELGFAADEMLVIEDSEHGTAAAVEAGLSVMVATNDYTRHGRFPHARLITRTLKTFTLAQLSYLCLEA